MLRLLGAALVALAVAGAPHAQPGSAAANDMQALRAAVKSDKHALVASTLALSDKEAKKFWPVYENYQRSLDTLGRVRAVSAEALLNNDHSVSNLEAKEVALRNMQADEAEMRARRKMFNAVMRALPAAKAARYVQLEAKIRAVQAYDIAQAFPLIH
ncbi:MAG: hypothetical protein ABI190_05800 [Casimicrobiaceae bacterium]